MTFYQIFLPVFTLIYILQVFVIKSFVQWKKTGINPFVFGNTDSAHDYIGFAYKIMMVGTWFSVIAFSFFGDFYNYLMPVPYLESDNFKLAGLVLLLLAFVWIVIAQFQMSKSWRIGINYEEKTELVAKGVFSFSRNPVFLGVLLSYLGTFLITPNILTFALLPAAYFVIQIQVRLEEEHLQKSHGADYSDYCSKVRRWF